MIDFAYALQRYNETIPGEWSVCDTYESLKWFGDPLLKPTLEQLYELMEV